jgi:hypothetical protein
VPAGDAPQACGRAPRQEPQVYPEPRGPGKAPSLPTRAADAIEEPYPRTLRTCTEGFRRILVERHWRARCD